MRNLQSDFKQHMAYLKMPRFKGLAALGGQRWSEDMGPSMVNFKSATPRLQIESYAVFKGSHLSVSKACSHPGSACMSSSGQGLGAHPHSPASRRTQFVSHLGNQVL